MLLSHFDEVCNWWNDRKVLDDGEKSQCFTPEEIEAGSYNLDLCKFPKEEEVILTPHELIFEYKKRRKELDVKIDRALAKIEGMLGIKIDEV